MREILFRGKRSDNGEWVYGAYCHYDDIEDNGKDDCDYIVEKHNSEHFPFVKVIPETIGQYIGLTDKNGKKVFEGDIFKFDDETWQSYYTDCGTEYNSWEVVNYGVVGFDEDKGCFDFVRYKFDENSIEADLHENKDIEFGEFISDLEIIGNIHDNPELLNEERMNVDDNL